MSKKELWTLSTLFSSDRFVHPPDWLELPVFQEFPVFAGAGRRLESHLGHEVILL
jgi:hypothetical protein